MVLKRPCRFGLVAFARLCVLLAAAVGPGAMSQASDGTAYNVYLDADVTHASEVGESLHLGLRAGLAEAGARFDMPAVRVLLRDHRNNLRRSAHTVDTAASDPTTLAIVGGMHTPHYLRLGPTINERGLVLLLAWSAGESLTRLATGTGNHIFRVSVDDRKATAFLADNASGRGCLRAGILALDDGWGRAGAIALERHLGGLGTDPVYTGFIRSDSASQTVADVVEDMRALAPDCVLFILSGRTSAYAANALLAWANPPEVLSHWGILGDGYREAVSPEVWQRLDVAILYTCILEKPVRRPRQLAVALAAADGLQPGIRGLADLGSPAAFAHAYDVGLLIGAAAAQASGDPRWTEGRAARGAALRDALHALRTPVDGLLKTYDAPFSPVSDASPDAHEALGGSDLCLARMVPRSGVEPYSGVARR